MKKVIIPILVLWGAASSNAALSETVELTKAEAFKKASMALVELGAMPTYRDAELGVIKTDPRPLKLNTSQADCGKMFGIPYLKDKRVKTAAIYQVFVTEAANNQANVDVKVTIDGYMATNEGAPFFIEKTRESNKELDCKSLGTLESELIEKLGS